MPTKPTDSTKPGADHKEGESASQSEDHSAALNAEQDEAFLSEDFEESFRVEDFTDEASPLILEPTHGVFGLQPGFANKVATLIARCRAAGHDFRMGEGLRSPHRQARYYCQWNRRPPRYIDEVAAKMVSEGAPWLASVLRSYRDVPRIPRWQTSALPGVGWHQWGLAADCYCYRNGRIVGDGSDISYRRYAEL
ncbi:hypothetical protein GOC37_29605 [Sinorhizobium meliloti]|nr:hypothetical protein [Sinorhizobium meliloti]